MNPAPGQGLAGRATPQNAQVAAAQNRQQVPPLYRPEMMRSITFLAEDEKIKYEKGLAGLWKLHDTAVPGSTQQEDAKKKIAEFGRMLLAKIHQRRAAAQQQTQQTQQQPQQAQRPQQPTQQPIQQPGQVGAQPHPQQASAAQGGAGPPANMGNPPSQIPATGPQAAQNPAAAAAQARPLPGHIIAHLNDMQFQPPANVPDKAKWLEEIKHKYSRALYLMESARSNTKTIDQTLQENQSLPAEERKKLEERKAQLQKQYTEAISFANLVRKQYGPGGNQRPAQNGAVGQNAANQARPQTSGAQSVTQPGQGLNNGTPVAAPANSMQSSTAAVNAAIEAAKKQQLAAGRVPGAVNALPAQQGPPLQQPQQSQVQTPATPAQAQQSPVAQAPPAQPLVPQQQQQHQPQQLHQPAPPIKIEPGTQPLPAPLNTAIAAAAAGGMPSAGTPTQNSARLQTPQSATPTTANANIRPLTHAAAVNLASQPRPGAIPAPPTTGPGSTPGSGLNVIGGAQQQGHPHAHPSQPQQQSQQPLHSKLPIPKVLHEKATTMPTPVSNIGGIGSAGRPTYSGGGGIGGGVMNQPALPKTPAFQLDGEGERILNKKKLDELVRQVCGGTAEGQEGNMLTPEVEEVSQPVSGRFRPVSLLTRNT